MACVLCCGHAHRWPSVYGEPNPKALHSQPWVGSDWLFSGHCTIFTEARPFAFNIKKNFLSSKNKAWKKVMPVRDLNSWPVRYRCSALPVSHRSCSNPVQVWTFFWPYFHYCSGSVHYCGDRFHIYVFIPSSHIWFSYIHSQFESTFICNVNGRREGRRKNNHHPCQWRQQK